MVSQWGKNMNDINKQIDADELPRKEYVAEDHMSAARRVLKKSANALNDPNFVMNVAHEWMQRKIDEFPKLCKETRRVNLLKQKQLADIGNIGGWSESKDFKFDYSIPSELYTFMVNMVDRQFWSEDNEKVWRQFMKGILDGEDAKFLLYRCKQKFEGNELSHKMKVIN